jgi:hypothetical protein
MAYTSEQRPWTRWWWMGNALTETEVTRHLELFRDAGFGGVEVSPIYGPRGAEGRFVPFLSARWVELFGHTLAEARRLGLGVDLIAGTGWPFGGPWVGDGDAARFVWVESFAPGEEIRYKRKTELPVETLAVQEAEGRRYALFLSRTGQQVKRAAPGGEGNVLDHFDPAAVRRYLERFDRAFAALPEGSRPRCFFNDSWEVFGANATPDILAEFEKRRGYDLSARLAALRGDGDPDTVARVRSDYRLTVHDLTLEAFVAPFGAWAHQEHGAKMRNQAHGSPGNLLDLYAAADIPETEVFGPVRIEKSGLERLTDGLPADFGEEEEALVCRFASSAAHVAGRPLCSSESFTWAGEHGHVPPEHLKAEVDLLFTLGINHLFFHGTPFSPGDAPWPGWLFYATTHMAPTNPLWRDLPALNAYIARCQEVLQAGAPDADVLLYFPFFDLLAGEAGAHDLLQFMSVHKSATWLRGNLPDFAAAANGLAARGYAFDLISDRQLAHDVKPEGDGLAAGGGTAYRALLVAHCRLMPPETLERIADLADAGAAVLFAGGLPEDVPGLSDLEARRARLRAAVERLKAHPRVRTGADAGPLLEAAGVPREPMTDLGLEFARRRMGDERAYFIANPGREGVRGWVPLAHPAASATLTDPMSGATGTAAVRAADGPAVYLDLSAGASLLLRTGETAESPWPYAEPAGDGATLADGWRVEFIDGGPTLPAERAVAALSDWTTWGDPAVHDFSGTARYTLTFDAPSGVAPDAWTLELGRVCHSARVRLNGADLGTVIARPWHVAVPPDALKPAGNTLEIEVTNLMANRLAALEREKGTAWRPFLMVDIHYKPFEAASKWEPVPSGLSGPVRLVPMAAAAEPRRRPRPA